LGPEAVLKMRFGFWPIGILVLLSGVFLPIHVKPVCAQETTQILSPESAAIEKRLLALVNEERKSRGLPPLLLSDGLAALARRHSADLALSGTLSHLSSSGESFQDRLVKAGFFYAGAGENVARSETYVADIVHRSLMESPEHRENILDSRFDTAGIGAVRTKDGSYFVTQDFIRTSELLSEEAARVRIAGRIQEWRSARSLPPLIFQDDADRLAQGFAEARVAGTQTPSLADLLTETHVFIAVLSTLEDLDERSLHFGDPSYEEGGLGVSYGRLKDSAGGAYCVVVALYPKNKYISLTDGERGEVIRRAVNSIRQKGGLRSLEVDEYLAKEAARIASQVSNEPRTASALSPGPRQRFVFSFRGGNIEQIPQDIEKALLAPNLVRIGVHALHVRSKELPKGEYLVIGIVE
jgi:uncharacterized protein YkwD